MVYYSKNTYWCFLILYRDTRLFISWVFFFFSLQCNGTNAPFSVARSWTIYNWILHTNFPRQWFFLPHSIYVQPCQRFCNKVWRFPNIFCLILITHEFYQDGYFGFASLRSLMNCVLFLLWTFGWVRNGAERQLTFGITKI